MASFFENLWASVFTPGPTPTLIVATNASFACLQLLLAVLLFATRSIHFFILSFLTAGLWWAINWFAGELKAAKVKEEEAARLRKMRRQQERLGSSDEETETEDSPVRGADSIRAAGIEPQAQLAASELRKRRSLGDASGEASTEDEWEKVSEEGGKDG
ncbi:MAG: hypothetical protein M1832_002403 [Thelocarpon impressellum]|nr:MAG: hypothetical protein M1832_002403 [Thelocarpon impressellum]